MLPNRRGHFFCTGVQGTLAAANKSVRWGVAMSMLRIDSGFRTREQTSIDSEKICSSKRQRVNAQQKFKGYCRTASLEHTHHTPWQ